MHTPGPMQRHGVTRPLLAVLLVACAGAVVLVGAVVATARPTPTLGPQLACADVASSVGLRFTGDYGPVLPAPDAYGTLMQQNMGNGAAVGDYDGDGYLDVLLLGQAGQQTKLFHNDPAPGRRPPLHGRHRCGRPGRHHLQRTRGAVRRPLGERPAGPRHRGGLHARWPRRTVADPAQRRRRHVHGRDRRLRVRSDGLHRGRHDVRRLRRHRPPEHLPQLLDRGACRRPCPADGQGRVPGAEPSLPEPRRLPLRGRHLPERDRRVPRRQLHGRLRRLHR